MFKNESTNINCLRHAKGGTPKREEITTTGAAVRLREMERQGERKTPPGGLGLGRGRDQERASWFSEGWGRGGA